MNIRLLVVIIALCQVLFHTSQLLAQDGPDFLTTAQRRAYHRCLYTDWIADYCRFHASRSFRECMVANGAYGRVAANFGYWEPDAENACRALLPMRGR
jgi:hypothetical protein